jgi:hypothetical protein
MNVNENQEQLVSNSSTHISNVEITEETRLIDIQSNEEEIIPFIIPEIYDWNTSLISEVKIFNKILFFFK